MGPGLPGIGIASLFYIAAALFAPFRELGLMVIDRDRPHQLRASITQFLLGAGMLGALVSFYVLLDIAIRRFGISEARGPEVIRGIPNWVFAAAALAAVMAIGWLVGTLVSLVVGEESADEVAAAHAAGVVEVVLDLRLAAKMCHELAANTGDDTEATPADVTVPVGALKPQLAYARDTVSL